MKKIKLDKNALLGGIVLENDRYQVVHMNLKTGNQTDSYSNDKNILLLNISGKITVSFEEEVETVTEDDVRQAKNDLLATNDILFMQMIEPLSEFQLNFLRAIIAGVTKDFGLSEVRKEYNLGSYSNITRLKTALLERDLIEKQETEWVITDPIFAKWLKQKIML